MNLVPVSGKLVIKKYVEEPKMKDGNIVMPKEYHNVGIVHNIAPDSKYVIGQKVCFCRFGAWQFDEEIWIIAEEDVMAVVE